MQAKNPPLVNHRGVEQQWKWVYMLKVTPSHGRPKYKARLVGKGLQATFEEIFSLMVKMRTLCMIITLFVSKFQRSGIIILMHSSIIKFVGVKWISASIQRRLWMICSYLGITLMRSRCFLKKVAWEVWHEGIGRSESNSWHVYCVRQG